jgi:hypothetical protein
MVKVNYIVMTACRGIKGSEHCSVGGASRKAEGRVRGLGCA